MIGKQVAHYEIVEKLGEGGMGVVYKARDNHLDRFVAIKVLPPERVTDARRKARFVQEAKSASALNHPNIVTIYDISCEGGHDFIAMEYIAGKTLEQLIGRKGLPLTDMLKYAIQIADALARAHGAGIVHRDLKPSNLMVDEHGVAKVLDFGLAKLAEIVTRDEDASTQTLRPSTEEGAIVGTAAYMSPEQAAGKALDSRSDIFSFGAVMYEMVTGHRAFQGDSKVSTLSAVLQNEPAPPPAETPQYLTKLIARCLRKDPDKRFQHMADLRVALEELKEESDSGKLSALAPTPVGRARLRALAGLAAVVALTAGWWIWKTIPPREPQAAFRETPFTADTGLETSPSFSPDGLAVAYQKMPPTEQWGPDSPPVSVMVKMIGTESTAVLEENATSPVWSPDGRWIAFGRRSNWFTPSMTALFIMPRIGGAERKIADINHDIAPGRIAAWSPDSKWLIAVDRERTGTPCRLVLVSVESGEKHVLTSPPPNVQGDFDPVFSPNGKALAFGRRTSDAAGDLYLLELDAAHRPTAPPRKLDTGVPGSNCPMWTPDGKEIVFCSRTWGNSTLWRIRADGSGPAKRLQFGGQGAYQPNLAPTGDRLVYTKHIWDVDIWRVELLPSGGAAGAPVKFIASSRSDHGAVWSPDGRSIAFVSQRAGRGQIWVCDSNGNGQRQLTPVESSSGLQPAWSPDGEWIAFHSDTGATATGNRDIYVVALRGGTARKLTADPADDADPQWSADGKYVYFHSTRSGEDKIWKVAKEGGTATLETGSLPGKRDPGGAWVYSLRSEGGRFSIWREPSGGGEARKVIDGVAERGFAVTRKGIYYVPRGPESNPWHTGLAFFEVAGGKSVKVVDLKPHLGIWAPTTPAVSPDGRYLLYTQYVVETSDLVLVENFR